jgi:hypothetical protein
MARSKALANAEFKVIQGAFYGPEPDLSATLGTQLNWYSAMKDTADARQYIHEFLDAMERHDDIEKLKNVPDVWIPNTAGWLAHLALIGYPVPDSSIDFMERKIKEALKREVIPEVEDTTEVVVSVAQRVYNKASELIGEIEGMIDDGTITQEWSLYDYLRSQQVSGMITNKLVDHFGPIAAEILEAFDTKDSDLKEAYKKYSNKELENLAIIYQRLFDDAVHYRSNVKKARKPRAKKKPSVEKLLRHLQYQKSDEALKLVSVDPTRILGAQELWTYNTKNKLLSVFRANDSDGLNIRRSMITNINKTTSIAKKIGRKTEERLQSVVAGGKVILRNIMDEITGSAKPVTRIGKTTVLLRVL